MQWVGVLAIAGALITPPAVASAQPGCAGQEHPSPPAAVEELPGPAPDPLPWPAEPVGGRELGACGDVGPAGVPAIGAASFVLADLDTGAVLAARAPHARQRPASALKVLTALVVTRTLDLDTMVEGTADDQRIEGSKAGIGAGGHYSVRQLLEGLLLNSGNDTASALARTMGGDAATVAAMAVTARELGALDTRPATPSGLDAPGMASSAYDLALLFRVAMRDESFASIIGLRSVPFPGYTDHPGFTLSNTDRLLGHYPGTLGAKAGFTDAARHTLVGAAQRDGHRLVFALTRGEQRPTPMWQQAAALLDWGFAQPPGSPSVGTLVDAVPTAPPAAPVAAFAAAPPTSAGISSWAPALVVIGAAAALAGGVTALQRRRSRNSA